MQIFLVGIFSQLFALPVYGQKEKADSCEAIRRKNPDNRKTRRSYIVAVRKINADSALEICKTNIAAAEKNGDVRSEKMELLRCCNTDQLQRNKEAKPFFQKGIEHLGSVRDTFSLDDCQNSYGYLLLRMGEYKESLKNLEEALAYREFVDDTMGKAR